MTTDPDVDEQWHPGQVLEPGHPCPEHLRQQIRDAIRDGLDEHRRQTDLIQRREEHK